MPRLFELWKVLIVVPAFHSVLWAQTESVVKPSTPVQDPFAGLPATSKPQDPAEASDRSKLKNFFTENLGFRKEVMSQFDTTGYGRPASRQSIGFEVLKKFSTGTATVAA